MSGIARRRAAAAEEGSPAYRERQEAVRRAAAAVFRRRGFQATRLADIAEHAGVDRASLYYYVGSKEQLFEDVIAPSVEANIAEAEKWAAEGGPAAARLRRLIVSLMCSFENRFPALYVFVQEDLDKLEASGQPDSAWVRSLASWNAQYFAIVKKLVSQGLADGSIATRLPAGVVAHSVIGMLNYSHHWFEPNGLMDAEELGEALAALILDGLAR